MAGQPPKEDMGAMTVPSAWQRWIPRAAGAVTFGVGALVLLDWALEIEVLNRVRPDIITMKANTAVAFILSGASLWWKNGRHRESPSMRRLASGFALAAGLGSSETSLAER